MVKYRLAGRVEYVKLNDYIGVLHWDLFDGEIGSNRHEVILRVGPASVDKYLGEGGFTYKGFAYSDSM